MCLPSSKAQNRIPFGFFSAVNLENFIDQNTVVADPLERLRKVLKGITKLKKYSRT
jgi:hypothetical protein